MVPYRICILWCRRDYRERTAMKIRSAAPARRSTVSAAIALTATVLFHNGATGGDPVSGVPTVVDGDTVQIGITKIRLEGIDAPESDQICLDSAGKAWNCGISSRDELAKRTSGRTWHCHATGLDRYNRTLARCEVGGEDIQRWMVRNGWALSFVRYSRAYDAEEVKARSAKAGLWSGAFIAPWDWRGRNSSQTIILGSVAVPTTARALLIAPGLARKAVGGDCSIKGNVNRKGECIFHMPGSRYYSSVKMDLNKGKRWFCTAVEAEASGCRAAK
jgi:endonuclease YncB( thermonuclease family)